MGRFLGIDLGQKKVGLALSDPSNRFARDYATVRRSALLVTLQEILGRESIDALVIGLPLDQNGHRGEQATLLAEEALALGQALGLPVKLQDERLSSWEARQILYELGYRGEKIRQLEDQYAAKLVLQSFLDGGQRHLLSESALPT